MRRIDMSVETAGVPDGLEEKLADILGFCAQVEGVENVACEVRIVDNEIIRSLNARHRNIDSATDVLSFPSIAYPKGKTAGDCKKLLRREFDPELSASMIGGVVISLERAQQQAEEYSHSLERELCYLMAHSVFHLFGCDHMDLDDKRVMREREKRVMELARLNGEDEND